MGLMTTKDAKSIRFLLEAAGIFVSGVSHFAKQVMH
jgi:hypothetical protein